MSSKFRKAYQSSLTLLQAHKNIFYVLTYTLALRGSNVALLIFISHMVSVVTFGQISAVYVFVMSGAQIIGLPLIALALRSEQHDKENKIHIIIFWWVSISILLLLIYLIFRAPINQLLFSGSINVAILTIGCLWMCAMGLEIISGALAASSGKLRTMAAGSVWQAAATLSLVPAGIWFFGESGLYLVPFCGLIAGSIMVSQVFEWRNLSTTLLQWRRGAVNHLVGTMGPAGIAALSVTLLNMMLVSVAATSAKAYLDIALFGIALQLVGASTFIPQVLSNSALESGHRAAREGRHWRKVLIYWTLVSLGISGAIGAIIAMLGGSFAILYADGYTLSAGVLLAAGLLIALTGPVNVLSHVLIIGGRQWLSAAVCLVSTMIVIGGFVIQTSRSSEAMLWALVTSNGMRFVALSGFSLFEIYRQWPPDQNRSDSFRNY